MYRELSDEERRDQDIEDALYFGVSWDHYYQVWKNDHGALTRAGVPRSAPVHVPKGATVAETIRTATSSSAVLHRMTFLPGQYFPRIARPNDQHPLGLPSEPNFAPRNARDVFTSARHFSSLMRTLEEILETVEPTVQNFDTHGNRIRNLLILTCTECENQMRGILRANGIDKPRYKTSDFARLLEVMRLAEYSVIFTEMPWLGEFSPFADWSADAPTQSLTWYDDYNAAKHDRTNNIHRARLEAVFNALAGLWVLMTAQHGANAWRTNSGSERTFTCTFCPRWRYSDVYVMLYAGTAQEAEAINAF
ncbi:MAG: hypothetical protein ACU0FH_16800 [Heliomarina sp.]|uniref:hypothetical protein n=1 Tax=Heliomarina sp. TaxID=2917556 RepID=UPI0040594F13